MWPLKWPKLGLKKKKKKRCLEFFVCCWGEGEPAGETGVFRAAQQTADQTSSGHRAAGGDQVNRIFRFPKRAGETKNKRRCRVTDFDNLVVFFVCSKGPSVNKEQPSRRSTVRWVCTGYFSSGLLATNAQIELICDSIIESGDRFFYFYFFVQESPP